jgi:predicted deacetylase
MGARFLVRFDDICPTMNWSVWAEIEKIIDAHQVKPILAVVPDNRDRHLEVESERRDFWDLVHGWQEKMWSIGWHGYQHVYDSTDSGLVGVHAGSEFAGLPEQQQRVKLDSAAEIFRERGIVPAIWVAPGHAFDWTTVRLLREHGLDAISDGYFLRAVRFGGCTWVPQQLWRFRAMRAGLWTVCYHHNAWTSKDLARFEADVARFRDRIVALPDVLSAVVPAHRWFDGAFAAAYRRLVLLRSARSGARAE